MGREFALNEMPYVGEPKAKWVCDNCDSVIVSYYKPTQGCLVRKEGSWITHYDSCENIVISKVLDS
jgi:hypothetical protein